MGATKAYAPVIRSVSSLPWRAVTQRAFSSRLRLCAGHNRWSKIRHDKGRNDALKSKVRVVLVHDVELASKFGGPDPVFNQRLATAIANAKKGAMSKPSIESAIARGQGKTTSGAPLEPLTIEAMLPFSVGAVIECLTDQKLRALQDLKVLIGRLGGTITPTSFLFERQGRLLLSKEDGPSPSFEETLDQALEAGAMDVNVDNDGRLVVDTPPSQLSLVAQRLGESPGRSVESMDIVLTPNDHSVTYLDRDKATELEELVAQIAEDPRVQAVYTNARTATGRSLHMLDPTT